MREINSYTVPPGDITTGDYAAYKVVAVCWAEDRWVAYRGPADWSNAKVATEGDQLLEEAAQALFPSFSLGREYRP